MTGIMLSREITREAGIPAARLLEFANAHRLPFSNHTTLGLTVRKEDLPAWQLAARNSRSRKCA
jgi:hypothetical protein